MPQPRWSHLQTVREVIWRTIRQAPEDNLNIVSAGVAFFAFLALFPALTTAVSIYGMIGDPDAIATLIGAASEFMPTAVMNVIYDQLTRITSTRNGSLALSAIVSTLIALWSANNGVRTFTQALTIVHGDESRRSYISSTIASLSLTLGMLVVFLVTVMTLGVIPTIMSFAAFSPIFVVIVNLLGNLILFLIVVGMTSAIYRWGPDLNAPRWRWIWPGALAASITWVLMSFGFATLLQRLNLFNATYGSLTTVIVVMFWFYLTAYIFLVGGVLNTEIEQQSRRADERRKAAAHDSQSTA